MKELRETDLIDFSDKNNGNNTNSFKWIDRENLKRMSEAYSQLKRRGFDTSAQVRERIASLEQEIMDIRREISENDYEIKAFAQTIKYINQYREYKDIYRMYKKSNNPQKYRENHVSEISLFEDAARMLKKAEIDPERFRLEAFKAEYFRMVDENKDYAEKEKTCRGESDELRKYLSDLDKFLGQRSRNTERSR